MHRHLWDAGPGRAEEQHAGLWRSGPRVAEAVEDGNRGEAGPAHIIQKDPFWFGTADSAEPVVERVAFVGRQRRR